MPHATLPNSDAVQALWTRLSLYQTSMIQASITSLSWALHYQPQRAQKRRPSSLFLASLLRTLLAYGADKQTGKSHFCIYNQTAILHLCTEPSEQSASTRPCANRQTDIRTNGCSEVAACFDRSNEEEPFFPST